MTTTTPVDFESALEVVKVLLERSEAAGRPVEEPIVLLGGTAMAALGIREQSVDVDLYAAELDSQVAHEVEEELRQRFGASFRLDATTTENLWGVILVRDIGDSPQVATLETERRSYSVLALSVEDLFLVKLAADRAKDRADLALLAEHCTPESLTPRFNVLSGWYGDRRGLLGWADSYVRAVTTLYDISPATVLEGMLVADYIQRELEDAWLTGDE